MVMQRALLASVLLVAALSWHASAAAIPEEEPDSLRGALEALDRRQRALQQRPQYVHERQHAARYPLEKKDDADDDSVDLISDDGQPEDIGYGYQRERHDSKLSPEQLKQAMLAVLSEQDAESGDEGEDYGEEEDKRAAPASMFRERSQQQQSRQSHHKRSSSSASSSGPSAADERKYRRLLSALWERYQNEEQQERPYEEKRQDGYGYGGYGYDNGGYDFYNSPLGWGASHFDGGKRSGYGYDNSGYDLYNSPMGWGDGHFDGYYKKRSAGEYPQQRLTVKKRSSGAPLHHKTDEKTQAELAELFDGKKGASASAAPSTAASSTGVVSTTAKPATTAAGATSRPQKVIQKKSVDWSQYFGIDRRKKSLDEPTNEEERKMMERYYRTFALATTLKRKRSDNSVPSPMAQHQPELDNMDQKLKSMEDLIVDEAVKFTGAHQGTADPAEIKKVKDQVLERLAAAYSLEKMRQALVEFRSSIKGHPYNKRSVRK